MSNPIPPPLPDEVVEGASIEVLSVVISDLRSKVTEGQETFDRTQKKIRALPFEEMIQLDPNVQILRDKLQENQRHFETVLYQMKFDLLRLENEMQKRMTE